MFGNLPDIWFMKTARLETRLTEDQKDLVVRAVDYQGVSQTDFVLMTVLNAARKVVREQEILELNQTQSRLIAESLLNPPEPNADLREAFQEHRKQVVH